MKRFQGFSGYVRYVYIYIWLIYIYISCVYINIHIIYMYTKYQNHTMQHTNLMVTLYTIDISQSISLPLKTEQKQICFRSSKAHLSKCILR